MRWHGKARVVVGAAIIMLGLSACARQDGVLPTPIPVPTTYEEALATGDYVHVPGELLTHKTCVHEVPHDSFIDLDGSVWIGGELVGDEYIGGQQVDSIKPCPYPSFSVPGGHRDQRAGTLPKQPDLYGETQ